MFWWEDDQEEREQLGEVERMVLSRLAGPFESRDEYEWLRGMRIWARPVHPEVLTMGLDSAEVGDLLDNTYGLMTEIASSYERISMLFEGEGALVTSASEFNEMLQCQAARMRELLEALTPATDLLYRDYGGRGRIWKGVQEALRSIESDPTSPAIARSFEYACALCCALERSVSDSPEEGEEVSEPSSFERRWCDYVQQEVVRSVAEMGDGLSAAALEWARLGVAGLSYVDMAERLECVATDVGPAAEPNWDIATVRADGIQRVWPDYYLQIVDCEKLAEYLGQVAYAIPTDDGLELWPQSSYLRELKRMIGSCDAAAAQRGERLKEWKTFVHAPRVIVRTGMLYLPLGVARESGVPHAGTFDLMVRT